jgi:xanthine dehydrogenase YagT iron-sulfur-binding subunit
VLQGLGGGALGAGLLGGRRGLERTASASTVEGGPGAAPPAVLGPGPVPLTLILNGLARTASVEPRTTLLELLRERFDLTGAKPACDSGACGACTVTLDGLAVAACTVLALDVAGRAVTTVEGLAGGGELSPLQRAFVEHDALQCGFCTPGMLMSATALLARTPAPSMAEVRRALAGNLCRCGSYPKICAATLAAARRPGRP